MGVHPGLCLGQDIQVDSFMGACGLFSSFSLAEDIEARSDPFEDGEPSIASMIYTSSEPTLDHNEDNEAGI